MKPPTITTSRLILRGFTEQDIDRMHAIMSEKDIMRYFPRTDPPSREQVQRMIKGQLQHWEEHGYGWWAVDLRPDQQLIGWCGLGHLPETDEDEVAYLLSSAHWGQGLATEAALASLLFGFEQLGLTSIVGIAHPENVASRRVLEKLGMSFLEQTVYFGMDCYHYAIEHAAFEARQRDPAHPAAR